MGDRLPLTVRILVSLNYFLVGIWLAVRGFLVRLLAALCLVALIGFPILGARIGQNFWAPLPVLADCVHNPDHSCPLIDQAVKAGVPTKGKVLAGKDTVTYVYQDGKRIILGKWDAVTGRFKTSFAPAYDPIKDVQNIKKASKYIAQDLARTGAKEVSPSMASKILSGGKAIAGQAGEALVGAVPCLVWQRTISGIYCTEYKY
jgi:hypothetical protein